MQRTLLAVIAFSAIAAAATALAAPEYKTIRMEIDVAKPAQEVWAKVGLILGIEKGMAALSKRGFPTLMIDPQLKQHTNKPMEDLIARSAAPVEGTQIAALPREMVSGQQAL